MSAELVDIRSSWLVASDASERTVELMDDIPGDDLGGYMRAVETEVELREAVVLLQLAIVLLEQADAREGPRYVRWLEDCDAAEGV